MFEEEEEEENEAVVDVGRGQELLLELKDLSVTCTYGDSYTPS